MSSSDLGKAIPEPVGPDRNPTFGTRGPESDREALLCKLACVQHSQPCSSCSCTTTTPYRTRPSPVITPEDITNQKLHVHVSGPRMPRITNTQDPMAITNIQEMSLEGQQEGTEGQPYTVKVMSPGDLDSFATALARLIDLVKRKINQFERKNRHPTWDDWGSNRVSPEFESKADQIKRILLPSIPGQLDRLCDMLSDPIYLQKLEAPQLQDGMKVLEELRSTVDQMSSSITAFWTPAHCRFFPNHERLVERSRGYRCERVQSKLTDVFFNLNALLLRYFDLLPLPEYKTITMDQAKLEYGELVGYMYLTEECGDHLIQWLDMSELWTIGEHWEEMADELAGLLEELVEFPSLHKDILTKPLHEFVPILKLSRLFFNKISEFTSDRSHPMSEMNTDQLLNLIQLTVSIPAKLTTFYDEIECKHQPLQIIDLTKVSELAKLFHAPLNLLTNYLSDQAANPNSPQDFHAKFIQWYTDWQYLFSLAVRRFHIAYRDAYSIFLTAN
ncbi:hypothetical protein PGT21_015899 [Puccinia graminis f. sp. tritici]|uniref:Uncharacterized protein n=1 Tax=Puccinia graminis f. sp. tritici TaxID=56615 RepID=A0A5B0LKP0_PUCGR|nr:hypothetical protein PGT21_015899 [Puccinia graminis f. sp. tritici]